MEPTIRGFVQRIDVGRAGLVIVVLLHDDGTQAEYQIPDLDADPERFNERLSKLGLLRDAMNRAEPVIVQFTQKDGTRTVDAVSRVTRDNLSPTAATTNVDVTIVGVAVTAENQTGPDGERSDTAAVGMLLADGTSSTAILDLQVPERTVAEAQLSMIRDAQANGETLELTVENDTHRIVSVRSGGGGGLSGGRGKDEPVDGFVESISHSSDSSAPGNFATIEFTTAPPFSTGVGHVVKLIPFLPKLVQLLVVIGSPEYKLFLVGLRDKLRMRVLASEIATDTTDNNSGKVDPVIIKVEGQLATGTPNASPAAGSDPRASVGSGGRTMERTEIPSRYLVRGAKVLHALASASRPVWIQVSRKSLDVGPEAACTDGLPSNDLRPRTLRDLCLPYTAEWIGWGCFNHGVYRFQFELETDFEVEVDCKPLCVHASDDGKTQFAHACLDCEHEVRVRLKAWTCDQDFKMDVYRIR